MQKTVENLGFKTYDYATGLTTPRPVSALDVAIDCYLSTVGWSDRYITEGFPAHDRFTRGVAGSALAIASAKPSRSFGGERGSLLRRRQSDDALCPQHAINRLDDTRKEGLEHPRISHANLE